MKGTLMAELKATQMVDKKDVQKVVQLVNL
jgi:hypothetical protein